MLSILILFALSRLSEKVSKRKKGSDCDNFLTKNGNLFGG